MNDRVLIFGLGYAGRSIAFAAAAAGFAVTGTSRAVTGRLGPATTATEDADAEHAGVERIGTSGIGGSGIGGLGIDAPGIEGPDIVGPGTGGGGIDTPSIEGPGIGPPGAAAAIGALAGVTFGHVPSDHVRFERVPPDRLPTGRAPSERVPPGRVPFDRLPSDGAPFDRVPFDAAENVIATATHLLTTVPPDGVGDPVLDRYAAAIAAAPRLRWIGYLSSTVVYGNRDGGWVDEDTPPHASQARGERRVRAENAWSRFSTSRAVDLFRLAGIYGPGRSAFDELRAGRARRMIKPGHQFGRIHRDDIAAAVLAAMCQDTAPRRRVLNLADDEPSESAAVMETAAHLLGVPPPPAVTFAAALPAMSPMARSFWAENRKVASRKTQAALGIAWRYPTYREGLAAILAEEGGDRPV